MKTDLFRLDGKTAMVSGGAQGIGRGISEVLASAGAHVFFCDINESLGRATETELQADGLAAEFVLADVSDPDQMRKFADVAMKHTGHIDIICNNASYTTGAQHDVINALDDEWEKNISIGLMGSRNLTAAALPAMIKGGGGSVIVISSIQALVGCATSTAYTSVKAAQLGFVKSLAADYGKDNIRANAVCPGPIKVNYSPEPGTAAHDYQKSQTMLGRTGMPHDIGYAVLYLSSNEASFVTGAVLPVDGGWTAK